MANDIIRRIRLILDKNSARKAEDDIRGAAGGAETAMGSLKRMVENVGAAIVAAFGVRAILAFAKSAVEKAMESEKAWNDLRGTITAVGGDFAALEPQLRATAEALQDATTFDNEDYARALKEVISITGDVSASVHNMGLVANVAAQFFGGDLSRAAEAVGRAMNGNVLMLQRMGIRIMDSGVKPMNGLAGATMSAQQALDLLAQRSINAASRQTETFGGRVKQLSNLWGDFKRELGLALIGSQDTQGVLELLTGTVRTMIKWVDDNKDALRRWIHDGLQLGLTIIDATYRALAGLSNLMAGALLTNVGLLAQGWAKLAKGLLAVVTVTTYVPRGIADVLGIGGNKPTELLNTLKAQADALDEWGASVRNSGIQTIMTGVGYFTTPGPLTRPLPPPTPPRTSGVPSGRPQVGAVGAQAETNQRIADAWTIADQEAEAEAWAVDRLAELRKKSLGLTWQMIMGEIDATQFGTDAKMKLREAELEAQAEAAKGIVEVAAAALTGNLGPYAKMKAQQDALEGAEQMVRGAIALLNPLTAATAPGYFSTGAELLALSAAWGLLSGIAGGGSSGALHTGGGGSPSGTAGASSAAAAGSTPSSQEVHIELIGEGWDAMNPAVQRVIWGAQQAALERYGSRGTVRLTRRGR